jgi:hypothetical protein
MDRFWFDYLAWSNPPEFTQGVYFGAAELTNGSTILRDSDADFSTLDLSQIINLHVHWGTKSAGINDKSLDEDDSGATANAGVYRIVRVVDDNTLEIEPAARADERVSYSIGRRAYYRMRVNNCDFFVLDTRGHRELHDVNEPSKKGLSMLGKAQLDWLISGMKSSDADFFFIVSSVNLVIPHVGGGESSTRPTKNESWTVFLEEREKLLGFWDLLDKPVLTLTGDLHNSFVIRITDNV